MEDTLAQIQLKKKTLAVISSEENMEKLQALIQNSKARFVELTLQWEKVKRELTDEYELLEKSRSTKGIQYQKEQNKLMKLKESYSKLSSNLKEKCNLEDALLQKCQQMPKGEKRYKLYIMFCI